jgi:putative ABC transport system permease protein
VTRDPWRALRRVFRLPLTTRRVASDVDDELQFHLEGRIDELVAAGLSRDEAAAEARLRFGDLDVHRRRMRAIDEEMLRMRRRTDLGDALSRELKHAGRALARTPSFTAMTVLTLALGIGAATAIFAILDAVVLRPLPYPHGDRLVALSSPVPGIKASPVWGVARHEMFYFERQSRTLEDVGLYNTFALTVTGDGSAHQAQQVPTASVTANLFGILGIVPERGRLLNADDNRQQRQSVVVLGHGLWERRFGADPSIIGKTIDLEGYPMMVVGIVPLDAQLPDHKVDLWMPIYTYPEMQAISNHVFNAIGKLRPGETVEDAQRELTRLTARFPDVFPNVYTPRMMQQVGFTTRVVSLRDDVVGELVTKAIWILFGAVAVVLLIAAANVVNLFLVRGESRRLEVTVRGALGASRSDLAWYYLTESALLAVGAAFGAILLAWIGLRGLVAVAPSTLPRLDEIHLGGPSVLFAAGGALGAGILLGLVPVVRSRVDLSLLREGGRGATGSRRRLAARNVLVVSQMALALVLLAGAGLLVRSLRNLRSVQPGFDPHGVMSLALSLPNARYGASYQRATAFYEQLAARTRALPGVQSVGFGGQLPLELTELCTGAVVDVPGPSGERGDCVQMMQVSPGYFETLRIPVRGRAPDWAETEAGGAGAVVSGAFANRFWPNGNALERGVRCCNANGPFYRIVGVTGPVHTHGVDRSPGQVVYFPMIPFAKNPGMEQSPVYMRMVVRTTPGHELGLVAAITRIVNELDPQVPITEVQPMEQLLATSLARRSFTMMLLATAAALALVLSAVGIYGVISYVVAQRRGEIGIRMALGAQASGVRALVVRQSLGLALVGIAIGLIAALATTRVLGALLFGVSPTDPLVLTAATLLLLLLAAVASYAPARRASRVDPVEALRS